MSKEKIKENLRRFLLEKKTDVHSFGCVMLFFDVDKKNWGDVQLLIDEEDIYTEEGDKSFGREDEPHITLLYGLHATNSDDKIKEVSEKMEIIEVELKKITIFEKDKYDVVKFDIIGKSKDKLSKINKEYVKLPHTTDYPNYEPHSTLAYVKSGCGKKYIKTLSDDTKITVKCDKIVYSKADGNKITYKL